ncbi:hypothetical protein BK662_24950 [Pseudomonas frederiksbergensis]|uniref:Uncharacterized protein n=1 Tax=Pseudomonas frederiksbergensis TaxID=104087 RepID=A0A423HGM2_9PSED|nr:hypothetical protein BK662_24950 [Pseudomonas frederiksbergensis]
MNVSLIDEFRRYREQTFVVVWRSMFLPFIVARELAPVGLCNSPILGPFAAQREQAPSPQKPVPQQTETKMPGAMPGIFL